jgi:hypothetical protein
MTYVTFNCKSEVSKPWAGPLDSAFGLGLVL